MYKRQAVFLFLPLAVCLAQAPTPESVLGHKPGDDFYLASYDDSLGYFQKLAKATDKLKLVQVGKTTEGRDWYIAIISSAKNLADLDKYKDTAKRLALVKGLTDEQAHALAHNGKVIVHIDGGLHATEAVSYTHLDVYKRQDARGSETQSAVPIKDSVSVARQECLRNIYCPVAVEGAIVAGLPVDFNSRSRSSTDTPLVIQASAGAPFR